MSRIDLGISRIALNLGQRCLPAWPRDPQAFHYGLLAARLRAEPPDQRTQARQLLDQLAAAWPEHPRRAANAQQRQHLASLA